MNPIKLYVCTWHARQHGIFSSKNRKTSNSEKNLIHYTNHTVRHFQMFAIFFNFFIHIHFGDICHFLVLFIHINFLFLRFYSSFLFIPLFAHSFFFFFSLKGSYIFIHEKASLATFWNSFPFSEKCWLLNRI